MWYKELRAVRGKFVLMLVLYGGAALFVVTIGSPYHETTHLSKHAMWVIPPSAFGRWIDLCALITFAVAVLVGANVVAGEEDHNTVSFLLARPVSRSRVFLIKLGVHILAFLAACGLTSIPALIADGSNPAIHTGQSLLLLGTLLVLGVAGICLVSLISVLTHTVLHAISLSFLVSIVVGVAFTELYLRTADLWSDYSMLDGRQITVIYADPWMGLNQWLTHVGPALSLFSIAAALCCAWAGLRVFTRKAY